MSDDNARFVEGDAITAEPTYFEMIPHWIMEHPDITGNAIRLYLQLRKYADKSMQAFPSRKTLANDLGLNIKTLDAAKNVLLSIGAITVEIRVSDAGDYSSNLYTVMWDNQQKTGQGGPKNGTRVGQKMGPPSAEKRVTNSYPINPDPINLDIQHSPRNARADTATPLIDVFSFEDFWDAYPRKAAKAAARKAWTTAVKKVSANTLIEAAKRYNDDVNREDAFTAHAATWLNQERWLDGPLPRRSGKMSAGEAKQAAGEEMLRRLRGEG